MCSNRSDLALALLFYWTLNQKLVLSLNENEWDPHVVPNPYDTNDVLRKIAKIVFKLQKLIILPLSGMLNSESNFCNESVRFMKESFLWTGSADLLNRTFFKSRILNVNWTVVKAFLYCVCSDLFRDSRTKWKVRVFLSCVTKQLVSVQSPLHLCLGRNRLF